MRRRSLALLIVIVIIIIAGLCHWFTKNIMEPDTTTRNAVAKLTADQIVSIEIMVLGQPPYPRVVKDKKAIAALLKGLKNATLPVPMPKNRLDSIAIMTKTGATLGPFNFSAKSEADAFGLEFAQGLRLSGIKIKASHL